MPESYTETTKISYLENIKNSISGVIFGILLFIGSFIVLWMNEGNNVAQLGKANYMSKNAIEISAENIDRANDNKLVQLSGKAITDATFDLLRTMPLSDITITSIIQKAGVARVSFYRNYSSKEEVLDEVKYALR